MKNLLIDIEVTKQDKRFYFVTRKLAIESEYLVGGIARSTVFRIREDENGFLLEKKPKEGRIYQLVKVFPTEQDAVDRAMKMAWMRSEERRQSTNDYLREVLERQRKRLKGEGD